MPDKIHVNVRGFTDLSFYFEKKLWTEHRLSADKNIASEKRGPAILVSPGLSLSKFGRGKTDSVFELIGKCTLIAEPELERDLRNRFVVVRQRLAGASDP